MTLLSMTRGDSAVFTVVLTDASGEPLDLAETELTFTVKRSAFDADALIQKTVGAGITVTDESAGVATITLEPGDTADIDVRGPSLRWDVQIDSGGDIRTPLSGRLAIAADITLPA
jgi:hypothetical protein